MTSIERFSLSVIIPTHQGRASILRTVSALLAQADDDLEVVVVCDGPSEATRQVLQKMSSDSRLRILEKPKEGSAAARNFGLNAATSEWVAFMDDDDVPRQNWLATWRQSVDSTSAAATAGLAHWRNGEFRRNKVCRLDVTNPTMNASTIMAGAFVLRRDVALAVGGYDASLRAAQNQDLGLRVCDYLSQFPSGAINRSSEIVLDVYAEQGTTRLRRYGTAHADSAKVFLERYAIRLKRDPSHAASLYRIIARAQSSEGQPISAVRTALRACIIEPRNPANIRSALLAPIRPAKRIAHMWLEKILTLRARNLHQP